MLVITRKNGQKIMINDNIEVVVVEAKNGVCKIAINADKNVKIYREEVYLQVKLANMIGKSVKNDAIEAVSGLIKNKTSINKSINTGMESTSEEIIMEQKKNSVIRIKKKNDSKE